MNKQSTTLKFKEFAMKLRYNVCNLMTINEESQNIYFPKVHTISNDNFVKYLLSASYYFGESLSVYSHDSAINYYCFKCSVKGCGMKVCFHEKDGVICCNDRISSFEHNNSCHNSNKRRNIMYELTYYDLFENSYNHGSIHEFVSNHKDLQIIPSKTIYNQRTRINKKLNSVEYIIKRLNNNPNFASNVIIDQNKVMCGCVVINKLIINSPYCDVIMVDDTVGISKLNYAVENIVCKDANGCLQVVGFGYLMDKTQKGFEMFFNNFREISQKERIKTQCKGNFAQIILCDRSKPQYNAIKYSFPESKIIFCKHHLLMDVKKNCPNSSLYFSCYKMLSYRKIEDEEKFLKDLKKIKRFRFQDNVNK